ncbi:hypothetical protein MHYP_G00133310 [Metynnis hypsauchen]
MYGFIYRLAIFLITFSKMVNSIKFHQFPPVIVSQTDTATFRCSHDDSSLSRMYWYRQETASTALTLIGYSYTTGKPSYETEFIERFKMTRQGDTSGELIISDVKPSDSAVYFCAASLHSAQLRVTCSLKT